MSSVDPLPTMIPIAAHSRYSHQLPGFHTWAVIAPTLTFGSLGSAVMASSPGGRTEPVEVRRRRSGRIRQLRASAGGARLPSVLHRSVGGTGGDPRLRVRAGRGAG